MKAPQTRSLAQSGARTLLTARRKEKGGKRSRGASERSKVDSSSASLSFFSDRGEEEEGVGASMESQGR